VDLDEQQTGAALFKLNGLRFGDRILQVTYEQKRNYQRIPARPNKGYP